MRDLVMWRINCCSVCTTTKELHSATEAVFGHRLGLLHHDGAQVLSARGWNRCGRSRDERIRPRRNTRHGTQMCTRGLTPSKRDSTTKRGRVSLEEGRRPRVCLIPARCPGFVGVGDPHRIGPLFTGPERRFFFFFRQSVFSTHLILSSESDPLKARRLLSRNSPRAATTGNRTGFTTAGGWRTFSRCSLRRRAATGASVPTRWARALCRMWGAAHS